MRSISWKQSARGMGLISKKYDSTTEPRVTVLVQADAPSEEQMQQVEDCYSMARTVCRRILEEKAVSYRLVCQFHFRFPDSRGPCAGQPVEQALGDRPWIRPGAFPPCS